MAIDDFQSLLLENPQISLTLLKIQNRIIVETQSKLNEKMMHDTREQIIKLLLRLTQSHGENQGNHHYKIMVNFTNQELANMIGTSRETMNRMLTSFKKEKFIYEEEGRMVVDFHKIHDEVLY